MPAEWHFFATSHGKGPCDGVGGTVKRLAARASLQRPINNQITTPRQLFEFAESEIKSIVSTGMLGVRDFSSAATMRQERIVLQLEEPVNVINFASITGYVTAV